MRAASTASGQPENKRLTAVKEQPAYQDGRGVVAGYASLQPFPKR